MFPNQNSRLFQTDSGLVPHWTLSGCDWQSSTTLQHTSREYSLPLETKNQFHKGFNLSFDKSWKRKENTSCSYTFAQAALSFTTRSWRGRIYHILSHWQNANAALLMNIYDGTPRPRLNKFFILTWQPDKQAVWIRHVLSCRSPSWSRVRSPSAMHFSSNGPRIRMCTAARNKDMLPFKCALKSLPFKLSRPLLLIFKISVNPLEQRFPILVLGTHRSAHFACLPYLTDLIQVISSLEERSMNCTVCVR